MGTVRRRATEARLALAAVAAVFLMAACSPAAAPGTSASAGPPGSATHPAGIISLSTVSTLRSLFNRADGHTRLVLIFSPT